MPRLKRVSDISDNEPGSTYFNQLTKYEQSTLSVAMIVGVSCIPVISLCMLFDLDHWYIFVATSLIMAILISVGFSFGTVFHHNLKYSKLKK